MRMSTLFQLNQHVHRELMPRDKHLMGQGTQQQAHLQINLREKKKGDEKKLAIQMMLA